MKELIDKEKVVAEIERRIILLENNSDGIISMLASGMFVNEYKDLLSFLDNLEVKDVVAEQEGICNGILNTIIGDTWHIKIPLNKAGLKHEDKVEVLIAKI
jgi:hypothetical protein